MVEWLSANWVPLLGGGSLTAVINYLLFGKTTKEKEFKKTNLSQFIVDEFVIFSLNSLKN